MQNPPVVDYSVGSDRGDVVFRPLTPRALEAFAGLPLDAEGCLRTTSDAGASALFDRFDAAGLRDLTA